MVDNKQFECASFWCGNKKRSQKYPKLCVSCEEEYSTCACCGLLYTGNSYIPIISKKLADRIAMLLVDLDGFRITVIDHEIAERWQFSRLNRDDYYTAMGLIARKQIPVNASLDICSACDYDVEKYRDEHDPNGDRTFFEMLLSYLRHTRAASVEDRQIQTAFFYQHTTGQTPKMGGGYTDPDGEDSVMLFWEVI
jgi:hypothetical protein